MAESIPDPAHIRVVHHHNRSYGTRRGIRRGRSPPQQEPGWPRALKIGRWSHGAYDDMEAKGTAEGGAEPAANRPRPRAFTLPRATAGVAGR